MFNTKPDVRDLYENKITGSTWDDACAEIARLNLEINKLEKENMELRSINHAN
jgi:hypothetical protein